MNALTAKKYPLLTKIIVLVVLFISFSSYTKAFEIAGCYVGGVLYTSTTSKGQGYYYRTPGNLFSDCGFQRTGSTGSCRLFNGGSENGNGNYTFYSNAFSDSWLEVNCPIDDYVWFILLATVGFSVFRLKSFTSSLSTS